MGDHEDLSGNDAIAKIKELANDQICMLCTNSDAGLHGRPMATQGIDEDGTIWMFSKADSRKNAEIAHDSRVHLIYANNSKSEYISLDGVAAILRDQAKIDELWNGWAKTWFTEGKDDPTLTLIRIRPSGGEYWETKHNRMVALAKIAIGAITGKTMDDGRMGKLDP